MVAAGRGYKRGVLHTQLRRSYLVGLLIAQHASGGGVLCVWGVTCVPSLSLPLLQGRTERDDDDARRPFSLAFAEFLPELVNASLPSSSSIV